MKKPNFTNLVEMVEYIGSRYSNPKAFNFLKNGKWHSFSSQEFRLNVELLALAFDKIGLKAGKNFAIMANSSPIWLMFNFASMSVGAISVPVFANISDENLAFEINDADVEFAFCDNQQNLDKFLALPKKFKKIITFGFKPKLALKNIIKFEDLIKIGEEIKDQKPQFYHKIIKKIDKDDIATIIYTSGSTGIPKGVEITHNNLVTQINGAGEFFPLKSDEDVALSSLPLAHIFEGMVVAYYVSCGISIYFADDVKNLGNLLKEVKPTLMTVVPRMLEKTYAKMLERVENSSPIKKLIGKLAFKIALNNDANKSKPILYWLFDSLVYKKLKLAMGGNLRMIICGGAPLSKDLDQFFNNIGIDLFVGYGLTESSPVISANCPKYHKIGTIGKNFPLAQVKIRNGELLTKGPYVMKGYHKDEAKTKEVIDRNGWLKTGDLAKIDDEGFIEILGRKKELFKTSGGKYVSPVPIEQKLVRNFNLLTAALVIAEGRKFVSCLLFADFENLAIHKKNFGMEYYSDQDFLCSQIIQQKLEDVVKDVNYSLNDWEKIKKFTLIKEEISIARGDLTPSMKLKRNVLENRYKQIIEDFYS